MKKVYIRPQSEQVVSSYIANMICHSENWADAKGNEAGTESSDGDGNLPNQQNIWDMWD